MPVTTTTVRSGPYAGDGVSTSFAVTFPFAAPADLLVIERDTTTGVETVKTLSTHYAVSGGNGGTGTVTAVAPPPAGVSWTVRRRTSKTQETDWPENGAFFAKTVETAVDKLTQIAQELADDGERGLSFPRTDPAGLSAELPPAPARAFKALVFDADGRPAVSRDNYNDQAAAAAGSATAAAGSATAAAGSATAATQAKDEAVSALAIKANVNHAHTIGDISGLGSAAEKIAGTGAGQVLLLAEANKLPALDGSALTGLAGGGGGSGLFTSTLDKSANYTVVGADDGKLLNCTAGLTLELTAAATLGSGWTIGVRNSSTSGFVAINPDAAELVCGSAKWMLAVGESCLLTCTGTAFQVVGGGSRLFVIPQTNLEFYFQANSTYSYSSIVDAQKWRNMQHPSSGTMQSAYDVWRGMNNAFSADEPTLAGTEGSGAASTYWSLDGGDYFNSHSMPDFTKGLHKAGSAFTIGLLIRTPPSFATGGRLFSTCSTSNWIGAELQMNGAGGISLQVIRDTGGSMALIRNSSAISPSTVYALVLSIKQGIGSYLRANKSYLNCDGAATWDGTYSTPSSSDPVSTTFGIGAMPEGLGCLPNGIRLYSIAMYNSWVPEGTADIIADGMLVDAGFPV